MNPNFIVENLKLYDGNLIPQIGLGTYTLSTISKLSEIIPYSYSIGYRHFDTAKMYGNETQLGEVLKKFNIPRNEIFITSKILPEHMSFKKAIDQTKITLNDLKTDYLDLLLIHWPGDKANRLETWKACEFLKEEGLVKSIGVSNFKPRHIESLYEKSNYKPSVNQIEIHPFYYDNETIEYCKKNNIIVQAYSPFAVNDDIISKNLYLNELSTKYKKTIYQIILRWDIQNGIVVIPRTKSKKHLVENLDINGFTLTNEEMERIFALNINYKTDWDPESIKN